MKHAVVRGQQFALDFTFRGVAYTATGRYGYVRTKSRCVLVGEAKGPNGELTWSDSEGNFYVCPADEHWPALTAEIEAIFNS